MSRVSGGSGGEGGVSMAVVLWGVGGGGVASGELK